MITAVVLDIEGTTSSVRHVHDHLFPYSRAHLPDLLREPSPQVRALFDEARALADRPGATDAEVLDILRDWIDRDVKAPPLKGLQGILWSHGYAAGELTGHVYPDVPPVLRSWVDAGLGVHIYSSGSTLAQADWFRHSDQGDLLPLLGALFDTRNAGPKGDVASYRAISAALGTGPAALLFASDSRAELDAARAAGWHTVGVHRPGDPAPDPGPHRWVPDFTTLLTP
ncbi:acireductone synthase [Longispora sp. NPDC051575]|uniref:acireductone synthase n=1 Tax=Longispora sp. NPDC051575 TaxID=3154943 RepID=UPI00344AAF34